MKHFTVVLQEAFVVGMLLVVFYWASDRLFNQQQQWVKLVIAGALFHVVCEYTGVNKWYAINYPNN